MGFENREDHRETALIKPDYSTARRPERARGYERLNFDQHRALPLHSGEHGRARRFGVATREKQRRGVGYLSEPEPRHFKDPDLAGRAESVLRRAQHAEMMGGVAFKGHNRVYHMLHDPGAGDLA